MNKANHQTNTLLNEIQSLIPDQHLTSEEKHSIANDLLIIEMEFDKILENRKRVDKLKRLLLGI